MANERLRRAIQQAGLRLEDVAEHVEIDVKTAERWITKGRLPHARNRARTAQLLRRRRARAVAGGCRRAQRARLSDGELVRLYPHRGAVPHERWYELLEATRERLDVLVTPACSCRTAARISPTLVRRKAQDGVQVRLLYGDPDSEAVALRGAEEGIGDGLAARIRLALDVHARGVRRAGRRGPAARDDALQLDLPLRRRAAGQHARVRRAGRAVAGAASAALPGRAAVRPLHGELRARLGDGSAAQPTRRRSSWSGRSRGPADRLPRRPGGAGGEQSRPVGQRRGRRRRGPAAADPALGQRQLGVARRRDGPGREHLARRRSARPRKRPASTARSPAWSGSTRTRGT